MSNRFIDIKQKQLKFSKNQENIRLACDFSSQYFSAFSVDTNSVEQEEVFFINHLFKQKNKNMINQSMNGT